MLLEYRAPYPRQAPMHVRPQVEALLPDLISWRRRFHQYPELGFLEEKTSAFVIQHLQSLGWQVRTGVAKTGVVATLKGGQPGKVLAIRADMDALPIQELNKISYASTRPGLMHACGHDGHTAIALGVAKYLAEHRDALKGTVKLLFQPAEESPGGALPMIREGALKNPEVDAVIGLHLWNNLPLGTAGIQAGPIMANADQFILKIQGRGGHGAMPHQTVDAVVVASHVVTALQTIVSRNVNPFESAVVTVGKLNAGSAFNIIAQDATLEGTVRSFSPELADLLPQRIEAVVANICEAFGAAYEFEYIRHYPAVINHPVITQWIQGVAASVLGNVAQVVPERTMGGEDMAYFLKEAPGCYFFLGSANTDKGLDKPHHHPCFDFDEMALALGVEIFVRCTEEFQELAVPSLTEVAQEVFSTSGQAGCSL
jgi:amidohydrolase